jgi:hypothetical protein
LFLVVSLSALNNFWIGLNDRVPPGAPPIQIGFSYIGDSLGRYTDYHVAPTAGNCIWYSQLTAPENIHMGNALCTADTDPTARYICEVSEACVALFMARYPTKFQHDSPNIHVIP